MPGLEGDESAAGAALGSGGTGGGVRASAGVGAGTGAVTGTVACAGTGAGGYGQSGSTLSCACKMAAPAQNARRKTHNWPAKDIRSREWEAQLMDITTVEEGNGRSSALSLLILDAHLGFGVESNWPVAPRIKGHRRGSGGTWFYYISEIDQGPGR